MMGSSSRAQSRSTLSIHYHHDDHEDSMKFQRRAPASQVPNDNELVLLCLDYLRNLRRTRSVTEHDLEYEVGLNKDYITLAIWALSKSFLRPEELLHGDLKDKGECLDNPLEFGNDPYFQPEHSHKFDTSLQHSTFKISNSLTIPSLEVMEGEIIYKEKPRKFTRTNSINEKYDGSSDLGGSKGNSFNPDCSTWYKYEDDHYSNQFRFYETMGLSSKKPLTLPEIAATGIAALNAQSRLQAEENMMSDQLFINFVDAVSQNGFFHITEQEIQNHPEGKVGMTEDEKIEISDKIHEERFRKVTTKFRTKLAAKYEEEESQIQNHEPAQRDRAENISSKKSIVEPEKEKNYHSVDDIKSLKGSRSEGGFKFVSAHRPVEKTNSLAVVANANADDDDDDDGIEDMRGLNRLNFSGNTNDDDATLVAASVFGDISTSENKYTREFNDDESSKISKSSRKVALDEKDTKTTEHLKDYGKVVSADEKDLKTAERLKGYGNMAMQKKKYQKAKNYYTKALELLPNGPTSHVYYSNRAAALLSMRNFHEAVWDAKRSISQKPDYAKAHARLGLAHFLLGNYIDAVNSYTLAVQYDPSNKTSLSYLEKSKKKLATTVNPHNDETAQEVRNPKKLESEARIVNGGSNNAHVKDSAERVTLKNIQVSNSRDPPEESRTWRNQSPQRSLSSLRSRLDKARKHSPPQRRRHYFDKEITRKDDPPSFSVASSVASTKFADDEIEADRLKGLGNKAMAKKDYETAVRYYSKSLRLAPAGPNSHVYFSNRAAALCYLERYEEAELDAERSLALNPEYGKAHARLGLSRYFLKDYYGAVEAYESALSYDPHNAASQNYLAKAKSRIGKRQARSAYYVE